MTVQSPGVVRFGTDQSDFSCYINMTIGQHSFYEHCQVGVPVLQVRRRQEKLGEAPQHLGRGGLSKSPEGS